MLDDYFDRAEIRRRHRAGLFGAYLDDYTSALRAQGFPRTSVRNHCYVIRHFGRWLERRRVSVTAIDEDVISEFWARHRRVPRVRQAGAALLRRLLELLRGLGVVPPAKTPERTEAAALAHRFGEYLRQHRSLAPKSVARQVPVIEKFLQVTFGGGPVRVHALGEKDITHFVLGTGDRLSPRTHQTQLSALRSFFKFLLEQGEIDADLAPAVPTVAAWRYADVPKYLTPDQVEQVLAACDLDTPTGRRDRAILLLLARLGLRAGEVARLELEDIHWRTGELVVRGKGSSVEALPLTAEIGEALATYIERDRPRCGTRRVFIRLRAPRVALANTASVSTVVCAAMDRAGLELPVRGAHVLRHSLATRMLRDGASMSEISMVLRHRSPATTEIYAKVDMGSLHSLAQPWPVGGAQ